MNTVLVSLDEIPEFPNGMPAWNSWTGRLYHTQQAELQGELNRYGWWEQQVIRPIVSFFVDGVGGDSIYPYVKLVQQRLNQSLKKNYLIVGNWGPQVHWLYRVIQNEINCWPEKYLKFLTAPQYGAAEDAWAEFHLVANFPVGPLEPSDFRTILWLARRLRLIDQQDQAKTVQQETSKKIPPAFVKVGGHLYTLQDPAALEAAVESAEQQLHGRLKCLEDSELQLVDRVAYLEQERLKLRRELSTLEAAKQQRLLEISELERQADLLQRSHLVQLGDVVVQEMEFMVDGLESK